MGLELIGGKTGGYSETANATAEGSRLTCRQRIDLHLDGRSSDPLPDGTVLILEETVEDAVGSRGVDPYVDKADQLRRIDGYRSGLLRDKYIAPQYSSIVDLVVKTLPLEFDVGGRICFLAPEAIETWKLGILKTSDIYPLVEFEGSCDGFTHHHFGTAERQPHE